MILPLYKESRDISGLNECPRNANMGLWYNKMCNQWGIEEREQQWTLNRGETETGKNKWINTVTKIPCGNQEQIKQLIERYTTLIRSCGGEVQAFSTTSRFVSGLGNMHPVENGFTWHNILGTPYLPGSSVKGVLRDWVGHWCDDIEDKQKSINIWFGSESGEKQTGNLIVFDALPLKPVKLEIEVMTPHYGPYYQGKENDNLPENDVKKNPPADWYSPLPIPFLTVAAGQIFVFGLAPRQKNDIDIKRVFKWLAKALENIGAGAKAASGYGSFKYEPNQKIPVLKDRPQFMTRTVPDSGPMSSIRAEMEEDGYSNINLDVFMNALTVKWLDRMDAQKTLSQDRLEIASYLGEWYQANKKAEWEKPKPKSKNYEKVMRIRTALFDK